MNTRRKNLFLTLPLLIAILFLGQIGSVELAIWLALVGLWLYGFFVWGSKRPKSHAPEVKETDISTRELR